MKPEFRQLRLSQLDRNLELARSLPPRPSGGWIASEKAEAEDRITLRAIRRVAGTMGCDLVYVLVPKSGSFAELAEQPTRERATRDVKSVIHTMALENQKPENANQLIEDEAQRRLNRRKTR